MAKLRLEFSATFRKWVGVKDPGVDSNLELAKVNLMGYPLRGTVVWEKMGPIKSSPYVLKCNARRGEGALNVLSDD